jgi:hypothetical protein
LGPWSEAEDVALAHLQFSRNLIPASWSLLKAQGNLRALENYVSEVSIDKDDQECLLSFLSELAIATDTTETQLQSFEAAFHNSVFKIIVESRSTASLLFEISDSLEFIQSSEDEGLENPLLHPGKALLSATGHYYRQRKALHTELQRVTQTHGIAMRNYAGDIVQQGHILLGSFKNLLRELESPTFQTDRIHKGKVEVLQSVEGKVDNYFIAFFSGWWEPTGLSKQREQDIQKIKVDLLNLDVLISMVKSFIEETQSQIKGGKAFIKAWEARQAESSQKLVLGEMEEAVSPHCKVRSMAFIQRAVARCLSNAATRYKKDEDEFLKGE